MRSISFFLMVLVASAACATVKSGLRSPRSAIMKQFRPDYEFSQKAGGWLKYHVVPGTWQDARLICHAEGAVLASPLDNELKIAILDFLSQKVRPCRIFTGVHATFSKGIYTSIEGVPLSRLAVSWAENQPNNYDNSEECLWLSTSDGTMGDGRCSNVLPYVCYKKEVELLMNQCGTTDPGYLLDPSTGNCYKVHKAQSWSQGYRTCASEGAYLAIINSELEARSLKAVMDTWKVSMANIGFHDWGYHGTWMTIHGQSPREAGFDIWSPWEPNNMTFDRSNDAGEFCGSIKAKGLLNDAPCNLPISFICERKPGDPIA